MWVGTKLGPGFVDLQVNGRLGIDFAGAELERETARRACHAILSGGTAAFLPTLVSTEVRTYRKNLRILSELVRSDEFAGRLLGLHLEGPFIAPDVRVLGAHRRRYVRTADPSLLAELQDWADGTIRLITIASEIEGASDLIGAARALDMTVSIGHGYGDAASLAGAAVAGAAALTHFGNGLPAHLPRLDNPIIAGLLGHGLAAMLILDGYHVPEPFARLTLRCFGIDGVILVSDAAPIAGLPPGRHKVFGQMVEVDASGRIWNPRERHFAGSSASLLDCVNTALDWGLIDPAAAVTTAFINPLALVGIDPALIDPTPRIAHRAETGLFEVTA